MTRSFDPSEQQRSIASQIPVLVVLVSPFYLNDLASIYIKDWRLWLGIDYAAVKLLPLLVVVCLIRGGRMQAAEFGLVPQGPRSFLAVFVLLTITGTIIDQNGYRLLAGLPGYASLGAMPLIDSPAWYWVDLTLGLALVGIVEELVFRGYLHTFLSRFTRRRSVIVVVSSTAFGLIHWSLGLHAVLITSLIGAVFMCAYLQTRALPAIMLAHFVINFVDFSRVVPRSLLELG